MPFVGLTVLSSRAQPILLDTSSESSEKHVSSSEERVSKGRENSDDKCTKSEGSILVQDDVCLDNPGLKLSGVDIAIRLPPLISPKSSYIGWEPPLEVSDEEDVLRELIVSYPT